MRVRLERIILVVEKLGRRLAGMHDEGVESGRRERALGASHDLAQVPRV